ncbi:hypothetical protein QVD17_17252 [Tagetes erecta]|uniref:Protein kinase domain-containing protein n=1 Tax=Tagetes erecta TaxID=13708 RepID=A0AAD8P069_TARER|nr:hypothetical protein QVD17_17252 [Tagetes erecta]
MSLIPNFDHLKIPLEDIKKATQNFKTQIGSGGYGPVYIGSLSLKEKHIDVAVKRLQTVHGQGVKEFLTEIQLLSRYKHQNIVSLVGFCEEGNENFLIYEYACRGSLDSYLKPKTRCPLTWKQRIGICIDAARGLDHLHNHIGANKRVIHRDIKSGNILLDHNWKAMIADFGFSKIGRANENDSYLITNICGTLGYYDPAYFHTAILTKESDIYSFGVVLLEVLCGSLCFINVHSNEPFLAPLAKRYYKEEKINLIIDQDLKNYMNSSSMKEFLEITFQCLQDDRARRPSIALVLERLEKVLELLVSSTFELEEALDLNKLVETLQMQQFEEELEIQELEEALELKELVKTLQMQHFVEMLEIQELEDALGLHELVETLQRREFEEALRLRKAWELQKLAETLDLEIGELRAHYEVTKALYDMPDTLISHVTRDKINSHLSKGILVDEGKVWLSIDDDGKTQEMISAISIMPQDRDRAIVHVFNKNSIAYLDNPGDPRNRFSKTAEVFLHDQKKQVEGKTQFLSVGVTYAAYIVLKPIFSEEWDSLAQCELLYTLNDSGKTYVSRPIRMEESEWWTIQLFQTTTSKRSVDFKVVFSFPNRAYNKSLNYVGIQFLPMQKFEDEDKTEKLKELTNLSTSNINLDDLLPSDYKIFIYYSNKEMMKKPQEDVIFPTREEAFSILSRGLLIKVTHQLNLWFWIRKIDGKKCFLLPPALLSRDKHPVKLERTTLNESRIKYVLHLSPANVVGLRFEVPPGLLSTNTTYGCYLVYKTPQDHFSTETIAVMMRLDHQYRYKFTYLSMPQVPVVGSDGLFRSFSPMNKLKTSPLFPRNRTYSLFSSLSPMNKPVLPRKRTDGWLEVNLGNKSCNELMCMEPYERHYNRYWQRYVLTVLE